MKNLSIRSFAAATVLALTSFATVAHAQNTKVAANVPFSFEYAGHAYTAGNYSFTARHDGVVELNRGGQIQVAISNRATIEPASATKIVFDRTGGQYYLRQILVAGSNQRHNFVESKNEKHSRTVNVAGNMTSPLAVEVAGVVAQ